LRLDQGLSSPAAAKALAARIARGLRKALPMKKLGKSYQRRDENFLDSALALLNKLPVKKSTLTKPQKDDCYSRPARSSTSNTTTTNPNPPLG
jgi:hypothetical protein